MKHSRKMERLAARRKAWDAMSKESQDATKRPGSFKKSGGTRAKHGLSTAQDRSRKAVADRDR